jgi:hypothetical protein
LVLFPKKFSEIKSNGIGSAVPAVSVIKPCLIPTEFAETSYFHSVMYWYPSLISGSVTDLFSVKNKSLTETGSSAVLEPVNLLKVILVILQVSLAWIRD